ncbi:MAG: 30S ribosomal protein S8 [Thermodesulfobacteriota bacterium]|nr:30S ribosomal protein S8 [Thermodesulfobacteriota bacterium]
MVMTDPLADMLTRLRNGSKAKFKKVDIPSSNLKVSIAKILKEEGYIKHYNVVRDKKQGVLIVYLKYDEGKNEIITGLKRVSKPGCRVYVRSDKIPKVLNGLGINILSTPKGVLTDKKARELNVGGELLCSIW